MIAQSILDMIYEGREYPDVIFEAELKAKEIDSCESMNRYIFSDGSVFVDCSDGDYYVE